MAAPSMLKRKFKSILKKHHSQDQCFTDSFLSQGKRTYITKFEKYKGIEVHVQEYQHKLDICYLN